MTPNRRNLIVGATVLVAMIGLGWMILRFGGSLGKPFAPAAMPIQFVSDRSDGLAVGSPVQYRGVIVGKIDGIRRNPDNLRVMIDASVDNNPPPPANVTATIRLQSLLGAGAVINLELDGDTPAGELTAGSEVPTTYFGFDVLPPEFTQLARELQTTAKQLRESGLIANINDQVTEVGELVKSLRKITDDPKIVDDLHASLDNLRKATDTANSVMVKADRFGDRLDEIAGKASQIADDSRATVGEARSAVSSAKETLATVGTNVTERLDQVARLLEQAQAIAAKVETGQGTAGLLINDPKLYQALVDSVRELDLTVRTMRRLSEQWEQEGIRLRLR